MFSSDNQGGFWSFLALYSILLAGLTAICTYSALSPVSTPVATSTTIDTTQQVEQATPVAAIDKSLKVPETDCEIRVWYNYQVNAIPSLNQEWEKEGKSLEERAKHAYSLRHEARIRARQLMADQAAVVKLQARDLVKYGNPDGPTFEYLVAKGQKKGLPDSSVYQGIIESSSRTNPGYNQRCD